MAPYQATTTAMRTPFLTPRTAAALIGPTGSARPLSPAAMQAINAMLLFAVRSLVPMAASHATSNSTSSAPGLILPSHIEAALATVLPASSGSPLRPAVLASARRAADDAEAGMPASTLIPMGAVAEAVGDATAAISAAAATRIGSVTVPALAPITGSVMFLAGALDAVASSVLDALATTGRKRTGSGSGHLANGNGMSGAPEEPKPIRVRDVRDAILSDPGLVGVARQVGWLELLDVLDRGGSLESAVAIASPSPAAVPSSPLHRKWSTSPLSAAANGRVATPTSPSSYRHFPPQHHGEDDHTAVSDLEAFLGSAPTPPPAAAPISADIAVEVPAGEVQPPPADGLAQATPVTEYRSEPPRGRKNSAGFLRLLKTTTQALTAARSGSRSRSPSRGPRHGSTNPDDDDTILSTNVPLHGGFPAGGAAASTTQLVPLSAAAAVAGIPTGNDGGDSVLDFYQSSAPGRAASPPRSLSRSRSLSQQPQRRRTRSATPPPLSAATTAAPRAMAADPRVQRLGSPVTGSLPRSWGEHATVVSGETRSASLSQSSSSARSLPMIAAAAEVAVTLPRSHSRGTMVLDMGPRTSPGPTGTPSPTTRTRKISATAALHPDLAASASAAAAEDPVLPPARRKSSLTLSRPVSMMSRRANPPGAEPATTTIDMVPSLPPNLDSLPPATLMALVTAMHADLAAARHAMRAAHDEAREWKAKCAQAVADKNEAEEVARVAKVRLDQVVGVLAEAVPGLLL
ncbi:hypothetical protein BC828DRAFT_388967 [Blastocladiella britannica]|nr:hypothetical protein BC828DRAFT_388967 [Blastocladiella britannica]